MIVHLLTDQKASEFKTGCGTLIKGTGTVKPDNLTAWSSDITCPPCATRLWVTHSMTKIIDLDDPNVARKFHFGGKPWGFRWLVDGMLVYVYDKPDAYSATCAVPIPKFVPECLQRPPTYADAQATAREWIIKHGENRASLNPTKKQRPAKRAARRKPVTPPKPFVPAGYEGDLCAGCGKIDEGDFVPNPTNMLEQVCMVCLLKK